MPRKSIPISDLPADEQEHIRRIRRAASKRYQTRHNAVVNARKRAKRAANPEHEKALRQAAKAAHPEKSREYTSAYRLRHPERVRATLKASRAKRKAERAAYDKARRLAEPEIFVERQRRWNENNREYVRAHHNDWNRQNPEKARAREQRKRARRAAVPINDFTVEQWRALCKAAGYLCCYCGKKFPSTKLTPDHLTPYAKQGSNTLHNILPCCGRCNSAKRDRDVPSPVQPFLLLEI